MQIRTAFALLCLVGGTTAVAATEVTSPSAGYPDRAIHLVVPYPAGGGADHWGQLVARQLAQQLGQPVIVDNVPGRGGNNGTAVAAKAAPDGYTLLLGSVGPLTVHPYTYESLPFNAKTDFVPIGLLESSPILLVAGKSTGLSSAGQLIAEARAMPDGITYASNGNGSPEEVAGEVFKKRLNLRIQHLPFDGAGPARKAVVEGRAGLMFDPCKGAFPAIQQGKQQALAVAAPARLAGLPDVPTFSEIGVPKYQLRVWTGILAPAGTPKPIVERLSKVISGVLSSPEVQKEIADEGGEAGATTPKEFANFIQAERKRWSELVRESGVTKVPG